MSISSSNNPQVTTNESKIRLIAFFVLLLTITFMVTNAIAIPAFLVVDFALRAFDLGKYSPLAIISEKLVQLLHLPIKPVYLPPKRFAARIGLLFSVALLVLSFFAINTIAVSSVLAFFAALESLLGFCAGCYVYSFLQRLGLV